MRDTATGTAYGLANTPPTRVSDPHRALSAFAGLSFWDVTSLTFKGWGEPRCLDARQSGQTGLHRQGCEGQSAGGRCVDTPDQSG